MRFIRKIELFTIGWISVFTLVFLYLGWKPTSLLLGGVFMLFNFHLLSMAWRSSSFLLWLLIKTPIFYGTLFFILVNPHLVNAKDFLVGATTLVLAILTSTLFKEAEV